MGPNDLRRRNGDRGCACVRVNYELSLNPRTPTLRSPQYFYSSTYENNEDKLFYKFLVYLLYEKNPRLCFNIQPNQFLCYRQGWWIQGGGGDSVTVIQIENYATEIIEDHRY